MRGLPGVSSRRGLRGRSRCLGARAGNFSRTGTSAANRSRAAAASPSCPVKLATLYVVYQPGRGRGHLALGSDLQFIQVVCEWRGAQPTRVVDNDFRANPFYGEGAGLTSVNGNRSLSFYDLPQWGTASKNPAVFMAETFLAQDTGIKDAAGKDIVNIFGATKWGWQMHSVP